MSNHGDDPWWFAHRGIGDDSSELHTSQYRTYNPISVCRSGRSSRRESSSRKRSKQLGVAGVSRIPLSAPRRMQFANADTHWSVMYAMMVASTIVGESTSLAPVTPSNAINVYLHYKAPLWCGCVCVCAHKYKLVRCVIMQSVVSSCDALRRGRR